jgi:transposase
VVGTALAGSQKKAADEGRVIVWVDQSGFYLLPHHVRTWAPHGKTPVLRVPLTRDHRSAIAALTADQRLLMQTQTEAYHSIDVVRFLRLLLRKVAGKLLLIWDGAPIHRGQPIKELLARGAAKRIHLERLPGYAPDLNPVEGIWHYLKCRELGNVCCTDFAELDTALRRAKERLRHKHHVLRGCIAACGYQL